MSRISPEPRDRRVAAMAAATAPAMIALAWPRGGHPALDILPLTLGALLLAAIGALWGGARREGLVLLTLGAAGAALASALQRPAEPGSGLSGLLGTGLLLVHAYGWVAPRPEELRTPSSAGWSPRVAPALLGAALAVRMASGVPAGGLAVALGEGRCWPR